MNVKFVFVRLVFYFVRSVFLFWEKNCWSRGGWIQRQIAESWESAIISRLWEPRIKILRFLPSSLHRLSSHAKIVPAAHYLHYTSTDVRSCESGRRSFPFVFSSPGFSIRLTTLHYPTIIRKLSFPCATF